MLDFFEDMDYFNEDERIVLNQIAIGVEKQECLEQLVFNREVTIHDDIATLMQNVYDKVNALSEEEWANLQKYLPTKISFSLDDEDDEDDELEEIEMENS